MGEPQKPFACSVAECGMSFTNEDHLHVHSKKHDMVLQLGLEQKAAFVADQTPTPTRFIRNCEEVGLFQDLQHVAENPFDEGFKKAMETKQGILCLENAMQNANSASVSDDVLHTPQMVFALDSIDSTLYSTGQRHNITISRSSSDESGNVKASATISTLSNEITISRTISNKDNLDKVTTEATVVKNHIVEKNETIYSKNVIKTVVKDSTKMVVASKDYSLTDVNKLQVPEKQQIMSQKSLDFVVDSLTSEVNENVENKDGNEANSDKKLIYNNEGMDKVLNKLETSSPGTTIAVPNLPKLMPKPKTLKRTIIDFKRLPKLEPRPPDTSYGSQDLEVMIKLPNGKKVKMKAVEDKTESDTKQIIKNKLISKNKCHKDVRECHKEMPTVRTKTDTKVMSAVQCIAKLPETNVTNQVPAVNKIDTPTINTMKNINTPVLITSEINGNIPIIINGGGNTNLPVIITNQGHLILSQNNPNMRLEPVKIITAISSKDNSKSSELSIENPKKDIADNDKNDKLNRRLEDTQSAKEKKASESEGNDTRKGSKLGTPRSRIDLESRSAASKRYRDRLKQQMANQHLEMKALREANQRLISEKAALKQLITEHMKRCPNAEDLRILQAQNQSNARL